MALTPQNNQAFLREVDDELRREQMLHAGRRYGLWIVVAVVLALVALAGWFFWQHRQAQAHAAEAAQYQQVLTDLSANNFTKVQAPLATLATSDAAAVRASALFLQGDVLLQKQDLKGAAAKFAQVAGDAGLPQPFRDLALVRQTNAEFDTLAPRAVVDRLRPLAVKNGAFLGSAGELTGIAYLRMGRRDLAGRMFAEVAAGESVPESIRQRAVQMTSSLGTGAAAGAAAPQTNNKDKNAG